MRSSQRFYFILNYIFLFIATACTLHSEFVALFQVASILYM